MHLQSNSFSLNVLARKNNVASRCRNIKVDFLLWFGEKDCENLNLWEVLQRKQEEVQFSLQLLEFKV